MAYSEALAARIRTRLSSLPAVREQKMMGGIAFMVHDKMVVGAHYDGNMMVRCAPEQTESLLKRPGVKRFEMKGKQAMQGWLVVDAKTVLDEKHFAYWVEVGLSYNKQLTQKKE